PRCIGWAEPGDAGQCVMQFKLRATCGVQSLSRWKRYIFVTGCRYLRPASGPLLPKNQADLAACISIGLPAQADKPFLGHRGDQRAILRMQRAAGEAAGALRQGAVLRVEQPAIQRMMPVEPHGM